MWYFCIFGGEELDCRTKNHDGNCADYMKKRTKHMSDETIVSTTQPETALEPAKEETAEGRLFRLASEREALKQAVKDAQAALDANTTAIAELVPGPETGQKTKKVSDDLKVIVKRELIYKPDATAMREFCAENLDSNGNPIFPPLKVKTSEELDEKGYKWYQKNLPQLFAKLAGFVTVKPAKTSVDVKPVKKKG